MHFDICHTEIDTFSSIIETDVWENTIPQNLLILRPENATEVFQEMFAVKVWRPQLLWDVWYATVNIPDSTYCTHDYVINPLILLNMNYTELPNPAAPRLGGNRVALKTIE